jgi:hypothetical protein
MLEQGTQTPSPAPDLIPAETKNPEDSHWDWYSKWGHFKWMTIPPWYNAGSTKVVGAPTIPIGVWRFILADSVSQNSKGEQHCGF